MADSLKDILIDEIGAFIESPDIIPALSDDSDRDVVDEQFGEQLRDELMDDLDLVVSEMLRADSTDKAEQIFEEYLGNAFAEVVTTEMPSYSNVSYLFTEASRISAQVGDMIEEAGYVPGLGVEE